MSAAKEIDLANELIVVGAVLTALTAPGSAHVIAYADVIMDAEGNATNAIEIQVPYMKSSYRLAVIENVERAVDPEKWPAE